VPAYFSPSLTGNGRLHVTPSAANESSSLNNFSGGMGPLSHNKAPLLHLHGPLVPMPFGLSHLRRDEVEAYFKSQKVHNSCGRRRIRS